MKIRKLLILLPLLTACTAKNNHPAEPVIEFAETIHNFGTLSVDEPIGDFDFVYTNHGGKKLVIYTISPSCDCVTATFNQIELDYGQSSTIHVRFDGTSESHVAHDAPIPFYRTIDVYTNASKEPFVLELEGEIE